MRTQFVLTAVGAGLLLANPAFAHHPSGVGSTGGAGLEKPWPTAMGDHGVASCTAHEF